MKKCEWCGKNSDKLQSVMSLGTNYKVCDSCENAHTDESCIKCGETIVGGSIKGKCYGCSQDEYTEKQRKLEEVANGVDIELAEFYGNGIEFTEADYEKWVTFGQGNFSPDYMRRCRQNWIRSKLVDKGGWTKELIESNIEELESLMEKHISKITDKKYTLVYYDGSAKGQKIRQFIDRQGNVFVIETK